MRKKFSIRIRTICLLMACLTALYSIPIAAYASKEDVTDHQEPALDKPPEYSQPSNNTDAVTVIGEVLDLRKSNSKQFLLSNGTLYCAIYNTDIHYTDETGTYRDIDNTPRLTNNGDRYEILTGDTVRSISALGNEELFSVKGSDYSLAFEMKEAAPGVPRIICAEKDTDEKKTLSDWTELTLLRSEIVYEDVQPGVDLSYVFYGQNTYENIILKENTGTFDFTFGIVTDGLTAELTADGEILFFGKDGTRRLSIPPSFMTDSKGEYSNNVSYSLKTEGDGSFTITVSADEEWLCADERAYPVMIDPPVYISGSTFLDTYIDQNEPSYSRNTSHHLWAGRSTFSETQIYIKYSGDHLPYECNVISASLSLAYDPQFSNEAVLGAYMVEGYWDADLTWDDVHGIPYVGMGTTELYPMDFVSRDFSSTDESGNTAVFDITEAVRQWNAGAANHGICIKLPPYYYNQTTGVHRVRFHSNDAPNQTHPSVTVLYSTIRGIEDYYSYTTANAGTAGTGYVNRYTGMLTHIVPTVSSSDTLFSYMPQLSYIQQDAVNSCGSYGWSEFAGGWLFDWQRSVSSGTASGNEYVIYRDSDGTEHYFSYIGTEASDRIFEDEDGLDLNIIKKYSNGIFSGYELKNKNGKLIFNTSGKLTDQYDNNGNRLSFVRYSSGRMQKILLYPNGETQGITELNITYDSDALLSTISCPHTGESVIFSFDDMHLGEGDYQILLVGCVYKKGNSVVSGSAFTYDATGHMLTAEDTVSKYKITYGYDEMGDYHKVISVSESAEDDITQTYETGQELEIAYGKMNATVRSSGSDDVYGNSDDLLTSYTFDTNGRAISCYTKDVSNTKIYGASFVEYEGSENAPANGITRQIQTSAFGVNLLANGNFEYPNNTASGWSFSDLSVARVLTSNSALFDGAGELKISFPNTNDPVKYASQNVSLEACQTYTLSCFVKASENISVLAEFRMWLEVCDSVGNIVSSCLPISELSAGVAVNTAFPLSLTFTPPEDGTYTLKLCAKASYPSGMAHNEYVLFDGVVLSEGDSASVYNYIANGDFSNTGASQIWETGTQPTSNALNTVIQNGVMRLDGKYDTYSYAIQRVNFLHPVSSPLHFVVSGWGKSESAINRDDSHFALCAKVYYSAPSGAITDNDVFYFDFNSRYEDWQYVAGAFATRSGCSVAYITMECVYENNIGTAFFDNVAMVSTSNTDMVIDYVYDEDQRLYSRVYSGEIRTVYRYQNESIEYVTNSLGNEYRIEYDTEIDTRPVGIYQDIDGDGTDDLKTEYTYNSFGQVIGEKYSSLGTGAQSMISGYTYSTDNSNFGSVISQTDVNGAVTSYQYQNGRLMSVQYPDGENGLCYTYDAYGRLLAVRPTTDEGVEDTDCLNVIYGYDSRSRLCSITTESTVYSFEYDSFGKTVSVAAGGRLLASYTYGDNNGRLLSVAYGGGYSEYYTYDILGRISSVSAAFTAGGTVRQLYTCRYDSEGRIKRYDYASTGKYVTYDYTYSGKPARETEYSFQNGSAVVLSSVCRCYDENDRLQKYNVFLQGGSVYEYRYTYDDVGNIATVTLCTDFHGGAHAVLYTSEISYDKLQRFSEQTLTAGDLSYTYGTGYYTRTVNESGINKTYATGYSYGYSNTVEYDDTTVYDMWTDYHFDSMSRLRSIVYMTFDEDGYLYSPVYTTYVYDAYGQLVRENNCELNRTYTYSYDDAGNILNKKTYALTYATNITASPIETVQYTYTDSANGDLLTMYDGQSISYDAIGNPVSYMGDTLEWNNRELVSIYHGESIYAGYSYGADGLRTGKFVGSIMDNTRHYSYIYRDGRLVRMSDTTDPMQHVSADFFYSANGTPAGYRFYENSSDTFEYYYFIIGYGSNIDAVMDSTGRLLVSYTYDAWGNFTETRHYSQTETNVSNALSLNPFRYRGYVYDTETGWYYLNSRYYDPAIGRFINSDRHINANNDLVGYNMYAYCSNNPVMGYDPTGEWDWGLFWDRVVTAASFIAGGLAGTIVGIVTFIATGDVAMSVGASVFTAFTFTGFINNAVNAAYYSRSDGESDLTGSSYVTDGYLTRWQRLDYAKKQTKEESYNLSAWLYSSEYSLHMYGWFATEWAHGENILLLSWIADKCYSASLDLGIIDNRLVVKFPAIILGMLGF